MGFISRTILLSAVGTAGAAAYLGTRNQIVTPLSPSDAIFSSKVYKKHNPARNPATQDVCIKRIPFSKIRPELLENPSKLTLEYCRGVWSGIGYEIQRRYLEYKYFGPETSKQLWSKQQLAESSYDKGTCITDHFEVVDKTSSAITVRCGDSPRKTGLRPSDGLFVIGATLDKERQEVELTLKSCLFSSEGKVAGTHGPMPDWMEPLHQWYARLWSETGSRRLLK